MVLKLPQKVQTNKERVFPPYSKGLINKKLLYILLKKDPIMMIKTKYNKLILCLKTLKKNGKKETKLNKQQVPNSLNKSTKQTHLLG